MAGLRGPKATSGSDRLNRPRNDEVPELAELAAENRLLRLLIDLTASDLDLDEVLRRVPDLVTEATGSDVCFVHLVDEERQRVVLAGATPPFDEVVGTVELAIGEGVAGWVALHAEPAIIPDKWTDRRYRYIPALRGEDFVSLVSVPMVAQGRVVGVLNVHSREERTYGPHDLALLTGVASLVARSVEKARLYKSLAEREEALEGFAARTVEAQELERRRLAGEIHDGISQRLVSLWYHLLAAEDASAGSVPERDAGSVPERDAGSVPERSDSHERLCKELEVAKELTTAALAEARAAIVGLRPSVLDDLGLGPGLESLARGLSGVQVELDITPERLPPHVEVALYRIAQEALQNVVKHAEASRVRLSLSTGPGGVRLAIDDDGRGFDGDGVGEAEDLHAYGMVGMRERAELIGATLTVTSWPGRGTTVEVVVPSGR
jgi:signal transduction histidine kinase